MSEEKRVYLFVECAIDADGYIFISSVLHTDKDDCNASLLRFKKRHDASATETYLPSYMTHVQGKGMKFNPDYKDDCGDAPKFIESGVNYKASFTEETINPDDLLDALRSYEICASVTRTHEVYFTVDDAESYDHACDLARESIRDGDQEHNFDSFSDEDIEIESAEEID